MAKRREREDEGMSYGHHHRIGEDFAMHHGGPIPAGDFSKKANNFISHGR